MKVKMLTTVRGSEHSYDLGETVEISEELALEWRTRNVCELLEEPTRNTTPKAETAEAKLPEKANAKKGKNKK